VKLDTLRHRLHQLPLHVLWLAGVKRVRSSKDDDNAPRPEGPDLVGQSAERFPANCQASFYIERFMDGGRTRARVRTGPDGEVLAKDNTGTLSQYEVADAHVILSKMGFVAPITTTLPETPAAPAKPPKKSGLTL